LPDKLRIAEVATLLGGITDHEVYNIVHLIYRSSHHESNSKDYEFSRTATVCSPSILCRTAANKRLSRTFHRTNLRT
jgi:hypothetical protein